MTERHAIVADKATPAGRRDRSGNRLVVEIPGHGLAARHVVDRPNEKNLIG